MTKRKIDEMESAWKDILPGVSLKADLDQLEVLARTTFRVNHYVYPSDLDKKISVEAWQTANKIIAKWNEAWGSEAWKIVPYGITFGVESVGVMYPLF